MDLIITKTSLNALGIAANIKDSLLNDINIILEKSSTPEIAWQTFKEKILSKLPFKCHLFLFQTLFPSWPNDPTAGAAWLPSNENMHKTNIMHFMQTHHHDRIEQLHQFSTQFYDEFWQIMLRTLNIAFDKRPDGIVDLSQGISQPKWLPDALLNIVTSCFTAEKSQTALIYQDSTLEMHSLSYSELEELVNRIANSFIKLNFKVGDAIAIIMPMNYVAIATYLAIIKMGGIVVSIADSFSAEEISIRLTITNAKAVVTQTSIAGLNKILPLYEKIKKSVESLENAPQVIVAQQYNEKTQLNPGDISWEDFLVTDNIFKAVAVSPMTPCNILFSSGTTATPKAIIWNHTTPIKVASDAFFHQDVQQGDILAWPTNLGWMMGPWLIFAALINRASIALAYASPKEHAFGKFIQDAKVTMLGVVPTLVSYWRQTECMANLNWQTIKCFSSTGECSNPIDMLYLMSLAHYKPVIEYCGGTEIGGAYISSTLIQANYPALFTTKTMGTDFTILDESGHIAQQGEVALIPPTIGLSTKLLNGDHDKIYFSAMPMIEGKILRRHGDQIKQYSTGQYSILGRVDDTMNLGGIKISAAEIERVLSGLSNIKEVAAVSIAPKNNGPHVLIIFATANTLLNKDEIIKLMQQKINSELNPLFKIHDVIFLTELPKTASNKIMRRKLREQYLVTL